MLIFTSQALAFIAVPKTGTSAIEAELRGDADIIHRKSLKHTSAQRFQRQIAPFLQTTFGTRPEVFAVLRAPEDQIHSWYKYRSRDALAAKPEYCGDLSFDAFVEASLQPDPPTCARIGSQYRMLSGRGGRILVDHLFAYEHLDRLEAFLSERFERRITFSQRNVSANRPADLSPRTRARLREARKAEFDLHSRLVEAGGKLEPRAR